MLPPPPKKPPRYPRWLFVLPIVVVVSFPIWMVALFLGVDWAPILVSFSAGYGAAMAIRDVVRMRNDERDWRATHERYRKEWTRMWGS